MRCKKANVIAVPKQIISYQVECPHCKTLLYGGITKDIIRMLCYHCKNVIELIFE